MDMFDSVALFHGEKDEIQTAAPSDVVHQGGTLEKMQTQYHVAVRVQKPRDLDKISKAMMDEAGYAGTEWYYHWTVKNKKTGKMEPIEGGTIGLAYALMREWTNCAVDCEYEAQGETDVFTARFIDIEKGVTQTRIYKQKRKGAVGSYDSERWEDMQFQTAQSKAIRNVIFAGTPRWLQQAAIEKAKQATLDMINRIGVSVARQQACDFLLGYGVETPHIEKYLKKKKESWTADDLAMLRSVATQIKAKQVAPEDIFTSMLEKMEAEPAPTEEPVKRRTRQPKAPPDPEQPQPPVAPEEPPSSSIVDGEKIYAIPPAGCPFEAQGEARVKDCENLDCFGGCPAWQVPY